MKELNVRTSLQKPRWKDNGTVAVPIATSFFMLAVLSIGIFSSGIIANDVHAGALPCDPSIATCIDPDCDPTITSCPPVNPPPQKSYACGPNAASACAPSGIPFNPSRTDPNDVVEKESDDGRPMMENLFSLRADGETRNDDDDGPDNNRVNQNNEQDIKNVKVLVQTILHPTMLS